MFRSINQWRLHMVVGMRTPRLSLIGVDDLVELILRAAERGECLQGHGPGGSEGQGLSEASGRGYYFACDDRFHPTYAQLGRLIARALDRRVFVWPVWRWVGRSIAGVSQTASHLRGKSSIVNLDKIREATADNWSCTSRKASEQLDFAPRCELQECLRRTGQWYRDNGWI